MLSYIYAVAKRMIDRKAYPMSLSGNMVAVSRDNISPQCLRDLDIDPQLVSSLLLDSNLELSFFKLYSNPTTVVPITASLVSLPSLPSRVPLLKHLPSSLSTLYSCPSLLLTAVPPPTPAPYYVGCTHSEYISLIKRMYSCGMVSFTDQPKVVNGLFGVPKPDESIRLIIDARPANSFMIPSPPVHLPSPTAFANLRASSHPSQQPIYVAKLDLDNFYHQLLLPEWLCPYFCLPPLPVDELISDIPLLSKFSSGSSRTIYPMCRTSPMGWSHAVFASQSFHQHMVYSSGILDPTDCISEPYTSHRVIDRTLHSIMIDDVVLLDTDVDRLRSVIQSLLKMYASHGIVVKLAKLVQPSCHGVEVFGLELNGSEGTLSLSAPKMAKLIASTMNILTSTQCTGRQLASVVGGWTWASLVRRECLSVFRSVYRFIKVADTRYYNIWNSVKDELKTMIGLAPFMFSDLTSTWCNKIIATDASSVGQGLATTSASPHDICSYVTTNSSWLTDHISRMKWSTIVSSAWRFVSHINNLEMNAMITGIKWLLSYPNTIGSRLLFLNDNQVCVYALSKGRTSAPSIICPLRKMAAHILASGLRVSYVWVPSAFNPADAASRLLI